MEKEHDNHTDLSVEELERRRKIRASQVNVVKRVSSGVKVGSVLTGDSASPIFQALRAAIANPVPEVGFGEDWRETNAEQSRQRAIESIKAKWNAPKRQVDTLKIERNGPWGALESHLRGKIGSGFLIGLIGQRGHGKTQLGVELMRYAAENELIASRYVSATELFMAFRATFNKESKKTEEAVLREFREPRLLVIDEAGKRGETDWEDRQLFELIDKRYGDMTDTLLLSNQSRDEFTRAIGPSLASRMTEVGGLIETNWTSFRV